MSRIHPAVNNNTLKLLGEGQYDHHGCPSKFTVWKRSSMSFQGTDGFTVYDEYGTLAFRVDNYSRKNGFLGGGGGGGGLVLMDGSGKALLTLKPKGLGIRREWNAYGGDCTGRGRSRTFRVFSMKKSLWFPCLSYKSKCKNGAESEAEVRIGGSSRPEYRIEGSFRRRSCCIRRMSTGEVVAQISRKRVNPKVLLGNEVFSLVVQPGLDNGLIMGLVVVLDRICRLPVGPLLCSC